MRRKYLMVSVLIILMLLGLTLSATAITFGEEDGDNHPYVGLVVFEGNSPIGTQWTCSGTLLSETVFLTAGHCTYWADEARVWFDPDLEGNPDNPGGGRSSIEAVEIFTHSEFDGYMSFPNTSDIGILILKKSVKLDQYGELPDLGYLDDLSTQRGLQDVIIRTVGYGAQMIKPDYKWELIRYTSTSMLVNLSSHLTDGFNIHTSNNPGQGHQSTGGSCLGDSGGPILYPEDSDTVVGVVSFGLNSNCKGADFAYRTDIVEAQDFIKPFLTHKKTNK